MAEGKPLYVVLWVDDAGAFPLRREDVAWYHENAGPLAFAWERDDRYPWSSLQVLTRSGADFSRDFLSHHLHPVRWRGSAKLYRLYAWLRLYWHARSLLRWTAALGLPSSSIRALLLSLGLAWTALLAYSLLRNLPLFFLPLLVSTIAPLGLAGLWYYVRLDRNWRFTYDQPGYLKRSLLQARAEFEQAGHPYPPVVRHGWNLPPASTQEFYLSQMGVLADASACPALLEKVQSKGGREIVWNHSQPYYASLSQDYNMPWDGKDEADRGLLELPVIMGNLPAWGFGEKEKELLRALPPFSLVSAYIHPWDDFLAVKRWVTFLKENLQPHFVGPGELITILLRRHPRPMLIDKMGELYWAFKRGARFLPVTRVDRETAFISKAEPGAATRETWLCLNTAEAVPVIWIEPLAALWENVPPGRHALGPVPLQGGQP